MRDYPYILQVQLRRAMRESLKELIPLLYSKQVRVEVRLQLDSLAVFSVHFSEM
jgi:hypothetical protein